MIVLQKWTNILQISMAHDESFIQWHLWMALSDLWLVLNLYQKQAKTLLIYHLNFKTKFCVINDNLRATLINFTQTHDK